MLVSVIEDFCDGFALICGDRYHREAAAKTAQFGSHRSHRER